MPPVHFAVHDTAVFLSGDQVQTVLLSLVVEATVAVADYYTGENVTMGSAEVAMKEGLGGLEPATKYRVRTIREK